MERLPTEILLQILGYMSKQELKVIGFLSSEYRSLVLPRLFHRIRPGPWEARRWVAGLPMLPHNNARLFSVVRVLDARTIRRSEEQVEGLRQLMAIIVGWEELILPADGCLPLAVFDDNAKLQLRSLRCTGGSVGPELRQLLLEILPACTNLVNLSIPHMYNDGVKVFHSAQSAVAKWVNRLEKYHGPPDFLNYLDGGTRLYQLSTTAGVGSHILQRLVGQPLLTLHSRVDVAASHHARWIGRDYLPSSLVPSLFPNLRYVAWFLIMSEPGSVPGDPDLSQTKSFGDGNTVGVNGVLFDAIQQLHHLRQVWFASHHSDQKLPEPVSSFVKDVERTSLPYLRAFCLWTPNSDPWSYTFRKQEVGSINEGRETKWACETNLQVYPDFD